MYNTLIDSERCMVKAEKNSDRHRVNDENETHALEGVHKTNPQWCVMHSNPIKKSGLHFYLGYLCNRRMYSVV